jgi:hypothetical protein
MTTKPAFEIVKDHEFKVREKVFVIDPNGFDIWEAVIVNANDGKIALRYPEYPADNEEFEDTARILVDTRVNRRIFNAQEATRQAQLPPLSSDQSEPFSDESESDEAGDYADPGSPGETKKAKKPKKGKAPKKGKVEKTKPRPKGARGSPRRSG